MRRTATAAIWIAGATVPLLAATLMIAGCCVLPFHRVVHKVMPLCHTAAAVLAAVDSAAGEDPAVPAREKERPASRMITNAPARVALFTPTGDRALLAPAAQTSYRSFISLGAIRCDRDVGLHALVQTFLI
jgi:hypothetical protein